MGLSAQEVQQAYNEVSLCLENEDLGKVFYEKLIDQSGTRLIDFENFDNNTFNVVTELTYKKDDDEFWPDIILLINGLQELTLTTHPDLYIGQCVPFYFCPRSIMLYLIYQANSPDLAYKGGQGPIIHLQTDLHAVVSWANQQQRRWAFTLYNAGSYFFED
ncbi:MAG: hypothetical protein ACI9T7_001266 [Oleiphilaceae bacterium]|jgi:hypothetical protein